jgi:glucose/arabinose dehydrogenase
MKTPGRRLLLLGLVAALAGCSASSPTSAPASSPPSEGAGSEPPSEAPASAAPSDAAPSGSAGATPDGPGPIALEPIADHLASPIGFATVPDGSLLVHERRGRVVQIDPATGEQSVFLDIEDRVGAGGEQGLLGLALHPDWPAVADAFVNYTDNDGNTVVSRIGVSDLPSPPRLDPATEEVLLRVEQPFPNHNGGQLAFGPDGYLYIGLGDGGSGGDPFGNGQNPDALLGKILRIDVIGDPAGEPYAIPPDNPFVPGGGAPEAFLTGLRNPWRFSFDPQTGALWIADVGQEAWEEVNRVDPTTDGGANLGWNLMEGTHCYGDEPCPADGLVLPVTEYDHGAGCSVIGGEVYRGSAIPSLIGWYVFSDYCSGTVFGVRAEVAAPGPGQPASAPQVLLDETFASFSAFGIDASGELYAADVEGGIVYRIVGG